MSGKSGLAQSDPRIQAPRSPLPQRCSASRGTSRHAGKTRLASPLGSTARIRSRVADGVGREIRMIFILVGLYSCPQLKKLLWGGVAAHSRNSVTGVEPIPFQEPLSQ
jgi:hypothetical protein